MNFDRYERQIKVNDFGIAGQKKLSGARVLMVGAGGLGSACLPYLVGAGVGHISVMDADKIDLSNLHRQTIYTEQYVGQYKAKIAVEKMRLLNSDIELVPLVCDIDVKLANKIVADFDIILDCTDNYNTKFSINDACEKHGVVFISASIEGMAGYLGVFCGDKFPSYRALFNEPSIDGLNCAESGVLGTVAGMFGMLQAHEAIKHITNVGDVLDKILMLDLYDFSMQKITIPHQYESTFRPFELVDAVDVDRLLDVREADEYALGSLDGAVNLPLSTLRKLDLNGAGLDKNLSYGIYCATGARAQKAAIILQRQGFESLSLLKVGIC